MCVRISCRTPNKLDVIQSSNVQDAFRPIPGLISCAGATGSVGTTCHAHATQMAYRPLQLYINLRIFGPLQRNTHSLLCMRMN